MSGLYLENNAVALPHDNMPIPRAYFTVYNFSAIASGVRISLSSR